MDKTCKNVKFGQGVKARLLVLLLAFSILVVSFIGSINVSAVEDDYIDFHGLKLSSTDELTGYHLNIAINELECNCIYYNEQAYDQSDIYDSDLFSDIEYESATLIVEFPNIDIWGDGSHFAFFATVSFIQPSHWGIAWKAGKEFTSDIDVDLSNNHYKYLTENDVDFSQAEFTWYNNNETLPILWIDYFDNDGSHVTLSTYNITAGDLEDNAGFGSTGDDSVYDTDINDGDIVESNELIFWDEIIDFLAGLFNIDSLLMETILLIIIVIIVGLIALKFLLWVFK